MNKSTLLEQIDFHDSSLIAFHWGDESIELECEGVSIRREIIKTESGKKVVGSKFFYISVIISQVTSLLIDNEPVQHTSDSLMEGEEGDIFRLEIDNNNMSMSVEWENYATKEMIWRNYYICGKKITVLIGDEIHYDD